MREQLKKKYWITALLSALPALSTASAIDTERESIVIFSRQGENQLTAAIKQMRRLYVRTEDKKVRDDLTALLMKQNRFDEAIALCPDCKLTDFSENELENLARAARNSKKFDRSFTLYRELTRRFPNNPNGPLGSALTATDRGKFDDAQHYLTSYQERFGSDQGYRDARNYLNLSSEGDMAKIGRLQDELARRPENKESVLQLYRLAAKYQITPLKDKLVRQYPDLLNAKDLRWKDYDYAVTLAKGEDAGGAQLTRSYALLTELSENTDKDNPLYRQALQDRLAVAVRLHKTDEAEPIYRELRRQYGDNPLPDYVEESYADYQLAAGSPFKALKIYRQLERRQIERNKKATPDLLLKLFYASSDAGRFDDAQDYLERIEVTPYLLDFTQKQRYPNPFVDRVYYASVNLNGWRGKTAEALELLNRRLADKAPGDPWVMIARSDFERARNNSDDALYWADKAASFFPAENHIAVRSQRAQIALDNGDYSQASDIINNFDAEERKEQRALLERYDLARAAYFTGSFGISHRTSLNAEGQPSFGNEVSQEYYLYTPKTQDGHSLYVHYSDAESPDARFRSKFRLRRAGAGAALNFYPFNMNLEAGKNIGLGGKTFEQYELKNKHYIRANLGYRANQSWRFDIGAARNGDTPVKAVYQNVYSKEIGFAAVYTKAEVFSAGANVNFIKFDDSNLRKSAALWGNAETFGRDRWRITNSLRFDYVRNSSDDDNIWYYNPLNSRSLEGGVDIAYNQPLNYRSGFTHHLRATLGHHWQSGIVGGSSPAGKSSEKTWSVSYAHEWRIGKKAGVSYEFGRKRNIYDGDAEYNNFGNLNFSVYL